VLADLWDRSAGRLPARVVGQRLREEFGGRFLCGPTGKQWMDPLVVEAFER
jgi:hypothetical protein